MTSPARPAAERGGPRPEQRPADPAAPESFSERTRRDLEDGGRPGDGDAAESIKGEAAPRAANAAISRVPK